MNKEQVAAEVWRLLVAFSWAHRSRFIGMAREIGLTPGDMKAMFVLSTDKPVPMGTLAQACDCDASTATWMVDRLEEQGLAERRALPADRRVKAVALTQKGAEVKADLYERLYEPPDALLAVDRPTLDTLRDALQKLPLEPPGHQHGEPETAARK